MKYKYGKIIGKGNTASVYEWEKNKVLKLFYSNYSEETVKKEFYFANIINNMNFKKPKAYEIISYEGRKGIIYEKILGENLQEYLLKTFNLEECAMHMAKIHKNILKNKIDNVPSYKDVLKRDILKSKAIQTDIKNKLLKLIDTLEESDTLCHGDLHPGNIFIKNKEISVIDFMNICHGPSLYDIARTVFLVQYTPIPKYMENKNFILKAKKTIADLYLNYMNISRESIKDYLTVITAARKGECPNEYDYIIDIN